MWKHGLRSIATIERRLKITAEMRKIRREMQELARYARQARNTEAETKACEIRLRAERRCGQLLKAMEKAKGLRGQLHGRDD
jgi:hypothetical protein